MLKYFIKTLKTRWLPFILAHSAKMTIRLILRTCRCTVEGLESFIATAETSPCILMLWHNRLIPIAEFLDRFAPQFIYTALISNSRDAQPLSYMALSYKSGRVLRVPHNARHRVLRNMIAQLNRCREVLLITPDGPRGPRYVLKPGVIFAAKETAAKVIPLTWEADSYWQLNTWDRLRIPKPFSKIKITFGNSLAISEKNKKNLEEEITVFESALH